jgi:uncharacterized protein
MIRVVIDTNILVSAVIGRPRLQRLDPQRIATLIRLLELASLKVAPTATLNVSDHEPDNRFYECADAAKADYIVTGNTKHFKKPYKATKIVTARQLLDIVAPGNK